MINQFATDHFPTDRCCVCGKGFTAAEWDKRHDTHEPECPRYRDFDNEAGDECACDLVAHDQCCPECNPAAGAQL